jgi:hypothetical protein
MAMTATTTEKQPVTYTLLVIFTVDPSTGERPPQGDSRLVNTRDFQGIWRSDRRAA